MKPDSIRVRNWKAEVVKVEQNFVLQLWRHLRNISTHYLKIKNWSTVLWNICTPSVNCRKCTGTVKKTLSTYPSVFATSRIFFFTPFSEEPWSRKPKQPLYKKYKEIHPRIRESTRSHEPKNISLRQCCGSGMFIPNPGSWWWFLPIPHLRSRIQKQQQKRGMKKIVVKSFFVATNFTKFKIILFWNGEENNLGQFSKNYVELFTQKIVNKLSKIRVTDPWSGIQDPGSRIRKKPIPDPGSRGQKAPDPRSGSATLVY